MADRIPERVAVRLRANRTRNGSLPYYEVDAAGCWVWQRETDKDGYGRLTWTVDGANVRGVAHRVMYVMERGPIAVGLVLDHVVCDNPPCVNPWHVEQTTNRENIARSPEFPGARTHCPKGHPYDDANTEVRPNGARACRECRRVSGRESMARWRDRRRAQGLPAYH